MKDARTVQPPFVDLDLVEPARQRTTAQLRTQHGGLPLRWLIEHDHEEITVEVKVWSAATLQWNQLWRQTMPALSSYTPNAFSKRNAWASALKTVAAHATEILSPEF